MELTQEQEYQVYLKVKARLEKEWRDNRQTEESKAKRREYMREYMKTRYHSNKTKGVEGIG